MFFVLNNCSNYIQMTDITQQFKNLSSLAVVAKNIRNSTDTDYDTHGLSSSSYQAPLSLILSYIQITALFKILNL